MAVSQLNIWNILLYGNNNSNNNNCADFCLLTLHGSWPQRVCVWSGCFLIEELLSGALAVAMVFIFNVINYYKWPTCRRNVIVLEGIVCLHVKTVWMRCCSCTLCTKNVHSCNSSNNASSLGCGCCVCAGSINTFIIIFIYNNNNSCWCMLQYLAQLI